MRTLSYHEQELQSEDLCPDLASFVTSIRVTDLRKSSFNRQSVNTTPPEHGTEVESRPGLFWWEIKPVFHFFKVCKIEKN